jgi:hypothetical protein
MPATVFTLCDTPDQEEYGCSSGSAAKVGTLLLHVVAIHVNMKRNATKESLSAFYDTYNHATKKEVTEGWILLDITVNEIEAVFAKAENGSVDHINLIAQVKSLTKIANFVGGFLHKANQKISQNVKSRLLDVYS